MIEARGDMFVVPNKAWTWNGLVFGLNLLKKACQSFNGWTEDTKMVQVWIVSKDLHTENLSDHGGHTKNRKDPENVWIALATDSLPYEMIKDVKEGESVTLDLPITVSVIGDDDTITDDILRITLTACQKDYRYRNFGNFEDVVQYVCA